MLPSDFHRNYTIINLIFIGIIGAVVLYSAWYPPTSDRYLIPSCTQLMGAPPTASTGLSRSFSCLVRLHFDEAQQYNPHGSRVFSFFIFQLFFRLVALFLLVGREKQRVGRIFLAGDANISLVLFVFSFAPFWKELL